MNINVSAKHFSLLNDKKQLMPETFQWDPFKAVEFDSWRETIRS